MPASRQRPRPRATAHARISPAASAASTAARPATAACAARGSRLSGLASRRDLTRNWLMLVTIRDIAELKSYGANLQRIFAYWQTKRGSHPMPRRSDLDPTEIPPHLLPGITLVDVVPDHRRYVYRLVGTMEAEVRG